MYEKAKKFTQARPRLKKTVGWVLVVVGFVALVTPLTPGGFLLIIGLEFVGVKVVFLDRLFKRKEVLPAKQTVV